MEKIIEMESDDEATEEQKAAAAEVMKIITPPTLWIDETISALKGRPVGVMVFVYNLDDADVIGITGNAPPSKMLPALRNLIKALDGTKEGQFAETAFAEEKGRAN